VIVGHTVNRLRNAAGLTQERLAELAGIDMRSLQRIEAGAWNMTVDYLDRLREALRCRWIDLIEGLDSPVEKPVQTEKPVRGKRAD
jgi:transcriptional regulator with XRE-family HTH domain